MRYWHMRRPFSGKEDGSYSSQGVCNRKRGSRETLLTLGIKVPEGRDFYLLCSLDLSHILRTMPVT